MLAKGYMPINKSMCSGGIDISCLVRFMVKLNGKEMLLIVKLSRLGEGYCKM